MKNVSVQLSDEYVKTLDDESDELDLSRAQYIRELIEQGREADATQAELDATQANSTICVGNCKRRTPAIAMSTRS